MVPGRTGDPLDERDATARRTSLAVRRNTFRKRHPGHDRHRVERPPGRRDGGTSAHGSCGSGSDGSGRPSRGGRTRGTVIQTDYSSKAFFAGPRHLPPHPGRLRRRVLARKQRGPPLSACPVRAHPFACAGNYHTERANRPRRTGRMTDRSDQLQFEGLDHGASAAGYPSLGRVKTPARDLQGRRRFERPPRCGGPDIVSIRPVAVRRP